MKNRKASIVLSAVILVLLLLSGCSFFADLFSSITGDWTAFYDWEMDGTYNSFTIEFKSDNTFETGSGAKGSWSKDGSEVTFAYSNGTTYTGTLASSGKRIEGTMLSYSGLSGQWYATKD